MKKALLGLGILLLAGCGNGPPEPSKVASTTPSSQPTLTAPASVAPSDTPGIGLDLAEPGRPFEAATLLDAMRSSRRPDGVPDVLETEGIATEVADAIWTYGGGPWTTLDAGGSCGPETCTLELGGTRPGMAGEDLWVFEIEPGSGSVEVASAQLAALPIELVDQLDALARTIHDTPALGDALLTSVRWLPPPAATQFVLGYRSGGEEGSCRIDLTIDASAARVVDESVEDC